MNNEQVAHLWANQSRPSAKGSSFYFDGDTIYSYGSHFPVARHHKGVVLFTSKGYSVTTARHISITRSAANHLTAFTVADVLRDPCKDDLKDYKHEIQQAALKAARARNTDWAVSQLERVVGEANRFAKHFGFKTKFTVPSSTDLDALKAKAAASAARERKAAAKKKAKAEKDAAETIAKWLAGERVTIPSGISKVYLRVKPVQPGYESEHIDQLETSKGALVSLAEARRAFKFIASKREPGWHRNGETFKVGDFQLDEVTSEHVKAGCHTLDWGTIDAFAKSQGWL